MLTALQKAEIIDMVLECSDPQAPRRAELCNIFATLLSFTTDTSRHDWLRGDYDELMEAGIKAFSECGFTAAEQKKSLESSPGSCSDSAAPSEPTIRIN